MKTAIKHQCLPVSAILLLLLGGGCSKTTAILEGGAAYPSGEGARSLVTFHATVEGRNLTRSMTPLGKNIQARVLAFDGTAAVTKAKPEQEGLYVSSVPGQLSGLSGYKMYLPDGVYNFYGVSGNDSYAPPAFSEGVSEPLFNGVDYLWWSGSQTDVTATQVAVPIVFNHCATQVVFDLVAGEGVTIDQLVTAHLTAAEQGAQMELATGAIAPTAKYGAGAPSKMGVNGLRAQYIMLPLQTDVPMQAYFDVLIDADRSPGTFSVDVPVPGGQLAAGDSYRFEAVIRDNGISLSSVDVRDWVDVDETGKPLYPNQKKKINER